MELDQLDFLHQEEITCSQCGKQFYVFDKNYVFTDPQASHLQFWSLDCLKKYKSSHPEEFKENKLKPNFSVMTSTEMDEASTNPIDIIPLQYSPKNSLTCSFLQLLAYTRQSRNAVFSKNWEEFY